MILVGFLLIVVGIMIAFATDGEGLMFTILMVIIGIVLMCTPLESTEDVAEVVTEDGITVEARDEYILLDGKVLDTLGYACITIAMEEEDGINHYTQCKNLETGITLQSEQPFEVISGEKLLLRLIEEKVG
jgi:hypothetical protein